MDKPLVQERRDEGSHVIVDGLVAPNIAHEMTNNGNKFVAAVASDSNRSYKPSPAADAATMVLLFSFFNLSGNLQVPPLRRGALVAFLDKTGVMPAEKASGLLRSNRNCISRRI
jgi:hypothetical protein